MMYLHYICSLAEFDRIYILIFLMVCLVELKLKFGQKAHFYGLRIPMNGDYRSTTKENSRDGKKIPVSIYETVVFRTTVS